MYECGREFARAHPQRARYLNIDSIGDRDPYIERLFEGFAFIAGRIRQKLDESLPQLTQGLINLIWPQFLQEIPSLTIVQFTPRFGFLQESRILPQGSEVMSSKPGPDSTVCKFRTTQPVIFNPLSLRKVGRGCDHLNNDVFSFVFSLDSSVKWEKFNLKKIKIFLHAELPTAMILHRLFTTAVKKVEIQYAIDGPVYAMASGKMVFPVGFEADEAIIPASRRSFGGHNLLREYFTFPEKFLFFEFRDIDSLLKPRSTPESIIVKVTTTEKFPEGREFSSSMFRLYCCPVANIFLKNAEPVNRTGLQPEYQIVADSTSENIHIHSIHTITGINKATGEKTIYQPYYTFRNINRNSEETYVPRYVTNASGKREMKISLGGPNLWGKEIREEVLLIEAWCTNGMLPRDLIAEGDISSPGKGFPDYLQFSNLTRPTAPYLPPQDDEYIWTFHTNLAANITGIANCGVLRKILQLYNWADFKGKNNKIESIVDVKRESSRMIYKGSVIFGVRFIVTIEEKAFCDTGDIHLFGNVLFHFLQGYVSINNFCELRFILRPSDKIMTWNLELRG